MKAERPPWYLSVVCGALLRVIEQVNLRSADYLGFLEKGQLPPARLTLTSFEQQLVLEGENCQGVQTLQSSLPLCQVLIAHEGTCFWYNWLFTNDNTTVRTVLVNLLKCIVTKPVLSP